MAHIIAQARIVRDDERNLSTWELPNGQRVGSWGWPQPPKGGVIFPEDVTADPSTQSPYAGFMLDLETGAVTLRPMTPYHHGDRRPALPWKTDGKRRIVFHVTKVPATKKRLEKLRKNHDATLRESLDGYEGDLTTLEQKPAGRVGNLSVRSVAPKAWEPVLAKLQPRKKSLLWQILEGPAPVTA